ncbi:hypothetical protein GCM10011506_38740 [Marivirga lumbricoides]|uniref:Uncharacterized protein n=1 Tax=Marivirga lumbricoides TaxID=1046115 RepID=A0ABQ1MZN8_9BACT|nr:hypothetical protein GCM10011506_38740 [Marivirga lumbricoides]
MEKELDKSLADLHQDRYLMHKVEPQIFGTQVRSEFVRFLGDDNIIPYDKEDIQQHLGKYDLVIDKIPMATLLIKIL